MTPRWDSPLPGLGGRRGDPDVQRLAGALAPIAGRVWTDVERIEAPSLLTQMAREEAANAAAAPAAPATTAPVRRSFGQRVRDVARRALTLFRGTSA